MILCGKFNRYASFYNNYKYFLIKSKFIYLFKELTRRVQIRNFRNRFLQRHMVWHLSRGNHDFFIAFLLLILYTNQLIISKLTYSEIIQILLHSLLKCLQEFRGNIRYLRQTMVLFKLQECIVCILTLRTIYNSAVITSLIQ